MPAPTTLILSPALAKPWSFPGAYSANITSKALEHSKKLAYKLLKQTHHSDLEPSLVQAMVLVWRVGGDASTQQGGHPCQVQVGRDGVGVAAAAAAAAELAADLSVRKRSSRKSAGLVGIM
jgi:hypothetical protein